MSEEMLYKSVTELFFRSAAELISVIDEVDEMYYMVERHLLDSEKHLFDADSYNKFRDSLQAILESRKQILYLKSKKLSEIMDPKNLSAEKYREFYKRCEIPNDTVNLLTSKMKQLMGVNVPVLELFPGEGRFTLEFLAGEPLYIADYYKENLDRVGTMFNDFFNHRRLMKVEIKDFDLSALPAEQIGIVISFNYFMVKEKDFIVNWAKEVFKILRPGGFFIFNFISGNSVDGINMAEFHRLAISDPKELETELMDIGYEVDKIDIQSGYGSTFSIRKPGSLSRMKMSSCLAKIIDKSEPLV
jgi:SAM-dependent methyltransferase